jgi:hypothetical protein
MTDIRLGFGLGQINGTIYVGGGYGPHIGGTTDMALSYMESYDPQTDNWAELPQMLAPVEYPACAVVSNIIYFFGGDDATGNISGTVQGYVTNSQSWGYGNYVGFTPRTRASACVLNGLIYVIGGYNPGITGNVGGYIGGMQAYNPSIGSWNNPTASFGVAKADVGVAVLNGKIYAFGGNSNSGPVSDMEVYDPVHNNWSYKNPVPFSGAGNGVVINGTLYAFSYVTQTVYTNTPMIYAYNPTTDLWSAECPMPYKRSGFETVTVNNIVYAIGGSNPLSNLGLNEEGAF